MDTQVLTEQIAQKIKEKDFSNTLVLKAKRHLIEAIEYFKYAARDAEELGLLGEAERLRKHSNDLMQVFLSCKHEG